MTNKLTKEELEALIAAAQSESFIPEERKFSVDEDIINFITFFNIKEGENRILRSIIYALYKAWSKNPVSKVIFSRNFNKVIPPIHDNFFYLNISQLNVTENVLKFFAPTKQVETKKISSHHDYGLGKKNQVQFEQFLKTHKLQKGTTWTENYCLYRVYDKWAYKHLSKQMSRWNFDRFCSAYFEKRIVNDVLHFGVSESVNQYITAEMRKNLEYAEAKEKQKKSRKIPRP